MIIMIVDRNDDDDKDYVVDGVVFVNDEYHDNR